MFFAFVVPLCLVVGALVLIFGGRERQSSSHAVAQGMAMGLEALADAAKSLIAFLLLIIAGLLVWFMTIPYGHAVHWW